MKTQRSSYHAYGVFARSRSFIKSWIALNLIAFRLFPNFGSSQRCARFKVALWISNARRGGTTSLMLLSKTMFRNGRRRQFNRFQSALDTRNGRYPRPLPTLSIGSPLDLSVPDAPSPDQRRQETRASPSVRQRTIYARFRIRISGHRKTLWLTSRYDLLSSYRIRAERTERLPLSLPGFWLQPVWTRKRKSQEIRWPFHDTSCVPHVLLRS